MKVKNKRTKWEANNIFRTSKIYFKHGFYKTLIFSLFIYPFPILLNISTNKIKGKKDNILKRELVEYIKNNYGIKFSDLEGSFALGGLMEIFIKRLYDYFPISENDVIYDLGATIGEFSLKCAKKGATCFSFELEKKAYESMKKNIKSNSMENKITAFHCKIDDEKNSVDNFVKKTKKIPTLIKIDIEGDEELALKGAKKLFLNDRPKIILETHSFELEKRCVYFLKERNYKVSHKINIGGSSGEVKLLFLEHKKC